MAAVAVPIQIDEISSGSTPSAIAQARELLLEYGRFVVSHPAAAQFCYGSLQREAAGLPGSYTDRGGGCLIATVASVPAGFVAFQPAPGPLAHHSWELKRLWVRPQARGHHLGRQLTQAVLDRAAHAGRTAVYLDTVPQAMPAAHRLYLEMGFTPCKPYNDNPIPELAYLVKFLNSDR
jgi:GNAT superfamily N-acetyltransferase